tara:strand:- start:281 stop:817 length:537 start_codon:yes stop_codon:yes gene_type:complete
MIITGKPTFIATYAPSNDTEQIISSGLDSTYSSYMFVFTDMYVHTATSSFTFQTGATYNTATTSAPYVAYHNEDGTSSGGAFESGIAWSSQTTFVQMHRRMGTSSDDCMAGIMVLVDPASTVHEKYFYYSINHTMDLGPASSLTVNQGQIKTTSAITQIQFKADSGNISGTIQLYGIT